MKSRRKYKAKMPTLPVEEIARNSELMQKVNWHRGVITQKIAPPLRNFGSGLRHPHHKIMFALAFFAVLVVVLAGIVMLAGRSGTKPPEQAEKLNYVYPFEPNDVRFTGDMQKTKFLENFRKANVERDSKERYKLLEENFLTIRGLYISTQSSEYRTYLEMFEPFMKQNFSRKVSQNSSVYEIPCLDALCKETTLPDEIVAIKEEIKANASIGQNTRDDIFMAFNAAGATEDKTQISSYYINALSALYSEYGRTKDEGTKATYQKLGDFIKSSFPDVPIPKEISL